jgi:hypothetical protein
MEKLTFFSFTHDRLRASPTDDVNKKLSHRTPYAKNGLNQ